MSKLLKKIDPVSLSWIIRYRTLKHEFPEWTQAKLHKTVAHLDGHTGGTMFWTVMNSKCIDEFGWDKWFQTIHPEGYNMSVVIRHSTDNLK